MNMQHLRESYVALVSTEALKAWQPSAAVFAESIEPAFADVTNTTAANRTEEKVTR